MPTFDDLPPALADGLPCSITGEWARQKHLRLWTYLQILTRSMELQYENRAYVDLFAGAGIAQIRGRDELILGSPMLALSTTRPFTHHVLCEADTELFGALEERVRRHPRGETVSLIHGEAEARVDAVLSALPPPKGCLSFCFVDPYDLGFDSRRLIGRLAAAHQRMDFLVLVAAQMDGQRNETNYLADGHAKIERLLDDPDWREKRKRQPTRKFATFLIEQFTQTMSRLGFATPPSDAGPLPVRTSDRGIPLYYLGFYSRHPLGYKFWREVRKYSTDQPSLF